MFSLSHRTDETDASQTFRRTILLALLGLTVFCGSLFSILNYASGNYGPMGAELGMTGVAFALMPVIPRTVHLVFWSLFYLLLLNSAIIYGLATPSAPPSIFAWIGLIPILSLLLLGRLLGTVVIVAYLGMAISIYMWRYHGDPVNGSISALANLAGASICLFFFSYAYEAARDRAERAFRHQAGTDVLTGLGNRLALSAQFRQNKIDHIRESIPFCLLLIDVDHFKTVNDEYGHDIGDEALCWVAALITDALPREATAFRYGGEEFCLLIADEDIDGGRGVAERIRASIHEASFEHGGDELALTVSIGLAEFDIDIDSLSRLISLADQRMYAAKRAGRNCVVFH